MITDEMIKHFAEVYEKERMRIATELMRARAKKSRKRMFIFMTLLALIIGWLMFHNDVINQGDITKTQEIFFK